jgi:phenylpropionate dioxygenase-like ring-hydroxylating dioxygenase large terminal subunit
VNEIVAHKRREPHPISGAIYEELGEGLVRVEDKAKNKFGIFRHDGAWIEGELTYADPHMLGYVGSPALPPGKDLYWGHMPPQYDDSPAAAPAANSVQRERIVGRYVGDAGLDTPEGKRSAGHIPVDVMLAGDSRPHLVPEIYRKTAPLPGGPMKLPVARYFEKKYHDLEVEHIWKKVWQPVCREDDIPDVGDYHLYEITHLQYLVVRTAPDEIKAYVNACLHRGRQLRDCHGKKAIEFRCPYHGWTWGIDGKIKHLTAEWDFPGVRDEVAELPQAKVATWGGFVFINPDRDAISFEDYVGPEMLAHYEKAKLQNRYKHADVVKVIAGNWKVVQEAFLEGWHTLATHPQLLLDGTDAAALRFDIFGHWSRMGHVGSGYSSPHRGMVPTPEAAIEQSRGAAHFTREFLRQHLGDEVEAYSDVELNEQGCFNHLFPNFSPWGGWSRVVYRFRPNGDNPEESLMQVMLLGPWAEGKPKPPPQKQRFLGLDDPWSMAPELGNLARIFPQDCGNVPQVHAGMKAKQPPYVWVSGYQESVIRNFHKLYEEYLGLTDEECGREAGQPGRADTEGAGIAT